MRWLPAHEVHAIERVNLTYQFAESLPAKPWQALLNGASLELPKQGFNTILDEQEITVQAIAAGPGMSPPGGGFPIQFGGAAGAAGSTGQATVVGRNFQIVSDNQVREEVQIHRNRFSHSSIIYDGWASHCARVFSLLAPYLSRALPMVNVQIIKLEYWDRFVFEGIDTEPAYSKLLRIGSPYLPNFAGSTHQLWHSHTGFFVPSPEDIRHLVNINVDVIDLVEAGSGAPTPSQLKRSVGIYTMAQGMLSPNASPSTAEDTLSKLNDLHTILKDTLADVITPEAADRISLNARASS